MPVVSLRSVFILLAGIAVVFCPISKALADQGQPLTVQVEAPEKDVLKAVQEVTQDQIIHGTYSYEKERILYGAHSAESARVFKDWKGPGQVFYKVAANVLAPRFFKDSGDIGTITVRYVVTEIAPNSATIQIDAVFVDARNSRHPSEGDVESAEYAAILKQLQNIQAAREKPPESSPALAAQHVVVELPSPPAATQSSPSPLLQQSAALMPAAPATGSSASALSVQDMEKRVEALRREVELRVKDSGAPLKAAPFRSSATLESLSAQTEVVILVLTPYWYGVETKDGHHGWVHHSQLEPLP